MAITTKRIITDILNHLQKHDVSNGEGLEKIKRKIARVYHAPLPKSSEILAHYHQLVEQGSMSANDKLENLLRLKNTRTLSGVTPVAIFTKPYPCPGNCLYCPTQEKVPKSYLSDEPAVMRAVMNQYHPGLQIQSRLTQYKNIGHSTDKIDLIIKGGSWSAYPHDYQEWFIKECFHACNFFNQEGSSNNLETEQKINETTKHRIIGINIETRPDLITLEEIKRLRKYGVTKVEIGVQSIYDEVLNLVNRGHTVEDTSKATKFLKDAGFKVGYHIMPNLPGSSLKQDLKMFETLFYDSRFQPDMLKIYPCLTVPNTRLYDWFKEGKYIPYSDQELVELLIQVKQGLPEYVRVDRLGRDIPAPHIFAGSRQSNIRQVVQREMRQQGTRCPCIRCREIRGEPLKDGHITLKNLSYAASDGTEHFAAYVTSDKSQEDSDNKLLALLRLRFTSDQRAIVRELHTYGVSIPLKDRGNSAQHKGLGKYLMEEAERISRENGYREISVISGVGVREYYRKMGYKLKDTEMLKELPPN